jgi:hypothetical protein
VALVIGVITSKIFYVEQCPACGSETGFNGRALEYSPCIHRSYTSHHCSCGEIIKSQWMRRSKEKKVPPAAVPSSPNAEIKTTADCSETGMEPYTSPKCKAAAADRKFRCCPVTQAILEGNAESQEHFVSRSSISWGGRRQTMETLSRE